MSALPSPVPERRSFRADSLEEALRLVSDELGPDAIVVRQREGVIGGVGGFFGRRCVELEVELPQPAPPPAAPGPAKLPDLDWAPSPEWLSAKARAVPAGTVVDLYDTGEVRPRPESEPQRQPEPEPERTPEGERETEAEAEAHGWPAPDEEPDGFVPFVPEPAGPVVRPAAEPAPEISPVAAAETAPAPQPEPAPQPPATAAEPQPRLEPQAHSEPELAAAPAVTQPRSRPDAAAAFVPDVELEPATAAEPVPEPASAVELEPAEEPEDQGELMRTLMAQTAPFTNEVAAHMAGHLATAYERTAFGRRLADRGLGDRLAREVVAEAETELRVFDPTQPFEHQVRAALARRIRVARAPRRKRRVVALVGPPGAGKTLAAARLCHAYRGQRRDVAALSLQPIREAFRLVEHTRALDVPLVAADELRTLPVELEKIEDVELVIVDTPGVKAGENARLQLLGRLLELVGADETHLLVPASLDANQVRALVESFASTVGVNRMMITHLDGPGGASAAVSASIDSKLPISFTATGVSWGMRPADPHDLAELVVA